MRLHENPVLFKNIVDTISQKKEISEEIIIKDYYVTASLKIIFKEFEDIIFIGGTSLSKCFNVINRFSEDVDLVAIGPSKKKKQKLTQSIYKVLKEQWLYGNVEKEKDFRLTNDVKPILLNYDSLYEGDLSPRVKIELLSIMEPFPKEKVSIKSILNEYLEDEEIQEYDMQAFYVTSQKPIRTMIEKIILQKEIFKDKKKGQESAETHKERARDFYDIHKIWLYYNKKLPMSKNNFLDYYNSRVKHRAKRTTITIDEFQKMDLVEIFKENEIEKQLYLDEKKLSIRDLNTKEIGKSLKEIDEFFINKIL